MKRREFLKLGFGQAVQTAGTVVAAGAALGADNWFRPPFAAPEADFLVECTRCDKCIEACEPAVIFRLPARWGLAVAGTPALDLLNRGCRLCDGWPCVAACETKALRLPEPATDGGAAPLPILARGRIETNACLPYRGPDCEACAGTCPVPGALAWNGRKPSIDPAACIGCGLCREACIVDPKAIPIVPLAGGDASQAAE